jgi:hypothetical protein
LTALATEASKRQQLPAVQPRLVVITIECVRARSIAVMAHASGTAEAGQCVVVVLGVARNGVELDIGVGQAIVVHLAVTTGCSVAACQADM